MIALCASKLGDTETYNKYLALSDTTKGAPTIHTYFQCKALELMGNAERADSLSSELLDIGNIKISNADVNDYYGVGAPAYPPFGYDIVKAHTMQGNTLKAFAYLAKGDLKSAEECSALVKASDSADFAAYLFGEIVK